MSSGNARQRSRQVLLKHHLAIDPEWFEAGPDRPDQVQRVEKPIRMRKHRRKHVKGEPGPDVQFVPLVDARAARSRAINEKLGPVIDPWRYMQAEDMNRLVPRVERKPRLRKHPKDAKRSISGHHQKTAKPDSAAQAKHGLQHQQRKPQQQQQQLPRAVRRADLEASRVRLFRERYGLDISDWLSPTDPADTVERIEKAVRMRKRRQAPNTTAAPGTTPHSSALRFDEHHSAHIRLSLDPHGITIDTTVISGGTPRARTIERLENGTWIRTHPPPDDLFPSYRPQPSGGHRPWVDDDNVLHLPSRTGGQDVVRVPPQQRVRRSCHLCHTLFVGRATDCRLCGHARCKRCPREPYVTLSVFPWGGSLPLSTLLLTPCPQAEAGKISRRLSWRCPPASGACLQAHPPPEASGRTVSILRCCFTSLDRI